MTPGEASTGLDGVAIRRKRSIDEIREQVHISAAKIATLGDWGENIDLQSLSERIPEPGKYAAGFDAGVACALGLIPADKMRLSATLHAAYTPEAVEEVRAQLDDLEADSEACWWLSACSVCQEGGIDVAGFYRQLDEFESLRKDPAARLEAAQKEIVGMRNRFQIRDGWAYTEADGGMQGAYLSGHRVAISYNPDQQLYFVGTYLPSLELDAFTFSDRLDIDGRPRSGPVHGSRQYVKCDDQDELSAVLDALPAKLQRHA